MNSLHKTLITLIILLTLAINLSATPRNDDEEDVIPTYGSLRGASRFLAQQSGGLLKCNKNPRLCRVKGSPGTPVYAIDLIKRGALNLSTVKFAIFNEADHMLNIGFAEDIETILEYLAWERQTMMFSTTMPSWIVKLTHKYLKKPVTIDLHANSGKCIVFTLGEAVSLLFTRTEKKR
ncbi:hypothetical protein L2E82_15665 [Cichorium intybus]|uniref:Uncharacterized protein n=1 Tax=Cichorium intybus TaxID=13427 RepID=A0ACB9F3V3_CICIN|nr:hypothetical protein L2E82_15665 [Cichorium intybus]